MKRAWVLLLLAGCHAPDPGPTLKLQPAPFRASLVERGEIGSEQEVKLSTPFQSKVDTILPEGSVVKPGEQVVKLGDEETRDRWERQRLKQRMTVLQVPLTRERGRLEVWRLGLERENAALDLQVAKLKYQLLDTGRAGTAIVEAAQTLGTLAAERETLTTTLPEATALHAKGYLSDNELATMRKRLAEVDALAVATKAHLVALEAGPRGEELSLERLKVERAASSLAGAEGRLRAGRVGAELDNKRDVQAEQRATDAEVYWHKLRDAATIKAPVAGVVIYDDIWTGSTMAKVKPGDAVDEGTALVTIADPTRQIVRAQVNDAAAARLHEGLAVRCLFDAYTGLVVAGTVKAIAPVANNRLDGDLNKLQAVEVRVALAHPDARLRPGMSANLEFVLEAEPNCLLVPTQAIGHDAKSAWVYVLERGYGARRVVTLGRSNERETVVLTGVKAGEEVLLHLPGATS
ncbi:MAG: efflux transporter, family, subunit [Cyanobacteria bacterium RYN_339]|nr:efflux transporter, family, subunit [Cyanobacteria bacterium RYN_339]